MMTVGSHIENDGGGGKAGIGLGRGGGWTRWLEAGCTIQNPLDRIRILIFGCFLVSDV